MVALKKRKLRALSRSAPGSGGRPSTTPLLMKAPVRQFSERATGVSERTTSRPHGKLIGWLLFALMMLTMPSFAQNLIGNGAAINNTGTIKVQNLATGLPPAVDGVFEFFGANQSIPATQYKTLMLSGSGTKTTTGGNFSVSQDITIAPAVTLSVQTGTSITLIGDLTEDGYLSGSIRKTEDLSGGTVTSNYGNVGMTLAWAGAAPGTTTVNRVSGVASTGNGNQSVLRYYDIAPTFNTNLNVDLVFQYADNELNGRDENTLELWRSVDGGVTWRRQGGSVNTLLHTITKAGVQALSRWTASDAANPLGPPDFEWVAKNIALTSGNNQSNDPNTPLSSPFVVTVTDAYGNPISGVAVTFAITATPGGGSLSATNATTNASGQASSTLTLGSAGSYTVSATSGALTGSPIAFTATATAPPPPTASAIAQVSGNDQSGRISTPLPNLLVVRVTSSGGAGVPGITVTFALVDTPATSTGHSLSVLNAVTNANGEASTVLTLGNKVGSYTVTATSSGLTGSPITFTANATSGAAASIVLKSGDNQSGEVTTPLADPFRVTVYDTYGNPVPNAEILWSIAGIPGGATGYSVNPATVVTDSAGEASTVFTIGTVTGPYTVTATSSQLPDSMVVFGATALPGAAARLVLSSGSGQEGIVRTTLADPFVVTVRDAFDNAVTGVNVAWSITQAPDSATGQEVSPSVSVTDSSGQASASLMLGDKPGLYDVRARSSVTSADSVVEFSATAKVGVAAFLVEISGNGQSAVIGRRVAEPFLVTVTDSSSNPIAGATVAWTIDSIPAGATSQELVDVVTTTDASGQASASFILGNQPGPYFVSASSSNLVGSPITFTTTAFRNAAVAMVLQSGNNQSTEVQTGLPAPIAVFVQDIEGIGVPGVEVHWQIISAPDSATGQALNDTTTVTTDSGVAVNAFRVGDRVGTYMLEAASEGLSGSPVIFTAEATPGDTRAPVLIVLKSGDNQSSTINTRVPSPFVVQVIDSENRPVADEAVAFSIDETTLPQGTSGQSISETYARTDSAGRASTVLTLGNKVGTYSVLAASPGLGNSPIQFTALATVGAPAEFIALSGNGQARRVNTPLQQPLVAVLRDEGGNPIQGATVQFEITDVPENAAGHSISTTSAVTDNFGRASTTLHLGDQPGTYIVTATTEALSRTPVNFTATATGLTATAIVESSGDHQVGLIRATLPVPISVLVTDQLGNPVDDVTVTFSIAGTPAGSIGHRLSVTTVQTDAFGKASTKLTLGTKVGIYTVHASSPGLSGSPVIFTTTALPGAALVQQSGQGQSGPVLTTLREPFVVTVLDASGTPVGGVSVIWSITGKPQGATGQLLSAITTTSNESGRATTSLTLGNLPGTYTVTATSAGLSGSPVTFTATASFSTGIPAALVLTSGDNQTGSVGTPLPQPFVVTVLDSASQTLERVNVTFTIETSSLPGGAIGQSLSAQNVPTDAQGRASTVLALGNKVGTYRVLASVPGVANSPIVFTATAQEVPGAALVYLSGSRQSTRVRTTLPDPFVTVVFDELGNPKSGVTVTFAIDSVPAGSSNFNLSATSVTTNAIGVASATLTLGHKSGRYVVSASSPGLANSPLKFVATGLPGEPSSVLAVSGNNQSKSVQEQLDSALVVRVVDADSNPVPGIVTLFLITSTPEASVGHSLTVSEVATNSNGVAATQLTLGDKLGIYKVLAGVAGVGGVEFSATTEIVPADVNGDREANIADLTTIIDHILGKTMLAGIDSIKADVNGDGAIDVADVVKIQQFLLGIEVSLNKSSAQQRTVLTSGSTAPLTASVSGEFEPTKYGVRFNMENDVEVKGFQLIVRFKNVVPASIGAVDVAFSRARMMEMQVNTSGRELRVVASNLSNTPIERGSGSILRFPRELSNLNDIEDVELIVSTGTGIHEALRGPVVSIQRSNLPVSFTLKQNYPNPFNPSTILEFEVPDDPSGSFNVALIIYNQLGQEVKTLWRGEMEAGLRKLQWNGDNDEGTKVASGVYYYRLVSRDYQSAKKMVLLR